MSIFIVNNIFDIGWLTVQYRLYWTQISYIGLGCASSNIAFFVQYNLYQTVNHPILYTIYIYIYVYRLVIRGSRDSYALVMGAICHEMRPNIFPWSIKSNCKVCYVVIND